MQVKPPLLHASEANCGLTRQLVSVGSLFTLLLWTSCVWKSQGQTSSTSTAAQSEPLIAVFTLHIQFRVWSCPAVVLLDCACDYMHNRALTHSAL